MSTYPKSPKEMTNGMRYFARMLDKIRLQARGELAEDYRANLGKATAADGACTNFLRVSYPELRERVLAGGSDEEILEWCFEKGRRLNEGDILILEWLRLEAGLARFRVFQAGAAKGEAWHLRPDRHHDGGGFDRL